MTAAPITWSTFSAPRHGGVVEAVVAHADGIVKAQIERRRIGYELVVRRTAAGTRRIIDRAICSSLAVAKARAEVLLHAGGQQ